MAEPNIQNRRAVVDSVNRDYPGLIRSDGGAFCDQVAHRLNKADGVRNWGRKRKNNGSFNDDVVTWRIGPTDAQKHLVDIIAGDARVPVWDVRPESEEAGNGTWAPPQMADRDTAAPPNPPQPPPPTLPTLDQWIHGEYPQLVAAYASRHGGNEPGHEWAAFQTCRRGGVMLPPGEAAWSFAKMLAHELAQ